MHNLVLKTRRLTLRPTTSEDVELIWPYVSDPNIPKYMSWNPHNDKSETKAFLNRDIKYSNITYTLFNPSIADFVLNEYSNNPKLLLNIYKALYTTSSLERLIDLNQNGLIRKDIFDDITSSLFYDAFTQKKSYDYLIVVSFMLRDDNSKKNIIIFHQFFSKNRQSISLNNMLKAKIVNEIRYK